MSGLRAVRALCDYLPSQKIGNTVSTRHNTGSRQFGFFTVSFSAPADDWSAPPPPVPGLLTVTISGGGTQLATLTFTPDNAEQTVSTGNDKGTGSVAGTLRAVFDQSGFHGLLYGVDLVFSPPNGAPSSPFNGTVILW